MAAARALETVADLLVTRWRSHAHIALYQELEELVALVRRFEDAYAAAKGGAAVTLQRCRQLHTALLCAMDFVFENRWFPPCSVVVRELNPELLVGSLCKCADIADADLVRARNRIKNFIVAQCNEVVRIDGYHKGAAMTTTEQLHAFDGTVLADAE